MQITIMPAAIEDAEEILAIYAPYVKDTAVSFEYDVPTVEEFAGRIRDISAKYPYLKAVDENGVIRGYAYAAAFKTRSAYAWSVETTIYLKQDSKGMGIGSVLYAKLEQILRDMGILNMNACIAVPKEKDEHLTMGSPLFHKQMGFVTVANFHDSGYKFDTWYDMIWMEKIIGEHGSKQPRPELGEWRKYL